LTYQALPEQIGKGQGTIIPGLEGRWAWGGVNATDALTVMRHFVDSLQLNGIHFRAGDVNVSSFLNSVDALLIARRFSGTDSSFQLVGDWCTEDSLIQAIGSHQVNSWKDIPVLTYGDANGSYVPPVKASPKVTAIREGMITEEELYAEGLCVRTLQDIHAGAVSLVFQGNAAAYVRDVTLPEGVGGMLDWAVKEDQLRVSWFSLSGARFSTGDPLLRILLQPVSERLLSQISFEITENSEIADPMARPYNRVVLSWPVVTSGQREAQLTVWPNPVRWEVNLGISLPEEGQVRIRMRDVTGRVVRDLYSGGLSQGQHVLHADVSRLAFGTYYIEVGTPWGRLMEKLVLTR